MRFKPEIPQKRFEDNKEKALKSLHKLMSDYQDLFDNSSLQKLADLYTELEQKRYTK